MRPFLSRFLRRSLAASGVQITVEKLREDAFGGGIGDAVVLGFDIDSTHLIGGE